MIAPHYVVVRDTDNLFESTVAKGNYPPPESLLCVQENDKNNFGCLPQFKLELLLVDILSDFLTLMSPAYQCQKKAKCSPAEKISKYSRKWPEIISDPTLFPAKKLADCRRDLCLGRVRTKNRTRSELLNPKNIKLVLVDHNKFSNKSNIKNSNSIIKLINTNHTIFVSGIAESDNYIQVYIQSKKAEVTNFLFKFSVSYIL